MQISKNYLRKVILKFTRNVQMTIHSHNASVS